MNNNIAEQIVSIIQQVIPAAPTDGHPYKLGEYYAVRTLTMIQTGKLEAVYAGELVLSDACWIADTGRWTQFLTDPASASEIELFADHAIVQRSNIIDATRIPAFAKKQK